MPRCLLQIFVLVVRGSFGCPEKPCGASQNFYVSMETSQRSSKPYGMSHRLLSITGLPLWLGSIDGTSGRSHLLRFSDDYMHPMSTC